MAEAFAKLTGERLLDLIVAGPTVFWIPEVTDPGTLVVEQNFGGPHTLLGHLFGLVTEKISRGRTVNEIASLSDQALAKSIDAVVSCFVRGKREPLSPTHPIRCSLHKLLALYRRESALEAKLVDIRSRVSVDQGQQDSLTDAEDDEQIAIHTELESVRAALRPWRADRPSGPALSMVVAATPAARAMKREPAPVAGGHAPARWALLSLAANAAADRLLAPDREGGAAAKFHFAARRLAESPAEIPDARRRLESTLTQGASSPDGHRIIEAITNGLRRLQWQTSAAATSSVPLSAIHCRGAWSIPSRLHDAWAGPARDYRQDLTKQASRAELLSALLGSLTPSQLATWASITAITAAALRPGAALDSSAFYLADTRAWLGLVVSGDPRRHAAERRSALRCWDQLRRRTEGRTDAPE